MDLMEIKQAKGMKFSIRLRGHVLGTDMHKEDGGDDAGMNPIELLVGALAACIGTTIHIYCKMHQLPAEGIVVNAVPTLASDPKRIQTITLDITLPEGFPQEKRESILRVAHKCPVHKAFETPPEIDIELA
ncbi:MAG: OsmC family protein [Elusimicrobia bacterium]|nr:OsmC family protein [Elusimicrobiota bacterium]